MSGQTFTPDSDTPRRVLQRWPDTAYPADHACHNPYGVWRVGPAHARGSAPSELAAVFMPTLRALLQAREAKASSPLTREEVEAICDAASCIAMAGGDEPSLTVAVLS